MENNNIHWKRKDSSKEFDSLEIPYASGITARIIHWKYFAVSDWHKYPPLILCLLLFIVLFAIRCTKQKKKSNYLNSHGEEAQEKPPGL